MSKAAEQESKAADRKSNEAEQFSGTAGKKSGAAEIISNRAGGIRPKANFFKPLVEATAANFEIEEISGDKGYLSRANMQTAVENNAIPYIAFKSNSRASNGNGNHLWNKLFHYYVLNQEKFFERYHQKSNVETTFSMIKKKFGGALRSKTRTAQINEALCKILAHN
ncbi:MAG TPA: transposase, partial [Pyrinomonadaceae bacterium]|nr:transposase [Pyrinomonadaceae bacterium]